MVGSSAEHPELFLGQLHATGVVNIDQPEVAFKVKLEPAAITDFYIV